MQDIDYDNECTCNMINWFADENGFEGCPFCEAWDGVIEEGDEEDN